MKTRFYLTVDIEFTIAGAFSQPDRFSPIGSQSVEGKLGHDEHGLGFILDTLQACGGRATFFVEAMNVLYFGVEPMGRIAQRIRDAGQDVQMHIHPCWQAFKGGTYKRGDAKSPPNDRCGTFPVSEMTDMLEYCKLVFQDWGIKPPVALRTGGFSTSNEVYVAQSTAKIPLASNVCMAVNPPTDPDLHHLSGCHLIHDVLEVPTLSFVDTGDFPRAHLRPFQVTAVSKLEAIRVLNQSHESGLKSVVAVTHAFEFFKRRGLDYTNIRPNRINQGRLLAICKHISRNPEKFMWSTFSDMATTGPGTVIEPARTVRGSNLLRAHRMLENFVNDRVWML